MSDCQICGGPIDTEDSLIAIEKHVPPGQKGCTVEFRWVKTDSTGDAPNLGSMVCALEYFQNWLENHMGIKPRVT